MHLSLLSKVFSVISDMNEYISSFFWQLYYQSQTQFTFSICSFFLFQLQKTYSKVKWIHTKTFVPSRMKNESLDRNSNKGCPKLKYYFDFSAFLFELDFFFILNSFSQIQNTFDEWILNVTIRNYVFLFEISSKTQDQIW